MNDDDGSEATLREVLENSQGASYKRNLVTNAYVYLSPIFTELTGRPIEAVKSMPLDEFLQLIHPDDLPEIQARVAAALQDGQAGHHRVDYRFRHAEGHYIWFRDEFKLLRADDGAPLALVGCVSDITAAKAVEQELDESRASLEALIESTSDLIWSVDRNHALTSFNSALADHLGAHYGTRARLGATPGDLLPGERAAIWPSLYEKAHREGPFRTELTLADGRALELALQPIRHGGAVVGTSVFGKDVTERNKAEQALHGSVAQVQALLRALPDLIFLNSRDGEYLDFRAYDEKLLLIPPEAFLHKKVAEVLPAPLADRIMAGLGRALDLNEIQEFQYDLVIGGRSHGFEARMVPCGEDQVVTISRDITERIQAESGLKMEKEKYRGLFEHMHSGFILMEAILDPGGAPVDHRLLEANAEFETQTGLKREEQIGRTSADLTFKWPAGLAQSFYRVALGADPFSYERFNESLQRHYDVRVFSPSPRHWGMLFHDITERKLAEQALRLSEEKFSKVFRSAPLLAAVTRLEDGMLLEVNDQYCRALGYTREELLGRTTLELGIVRPEERGNLVKAILGEGPARNLEFRMHARNGHIIPCLCSGERIDLGGETLLVSMLTDITERVAHEREVLRLNQLYDMLGQLGRALAHSKSREALLQEICQLAVTRGGFCLAWVGWVDPGTLQVKPVAWAGEAAAYLDGIEVWVDASPAGRGPTGTCIRENRTFLSQELARDPAMAVWAERASGFGMNASIATPIRVQGRAVGALTIYAQEADAFLDREVTLLEEAAAHISFGLDHLESEALRHRLESDLAQTQKMESLGSLAGGIAHDMNNVLGAILAIASAHLAGLPPDNPLYPSLETIRKAATRGGDMVKQLLAFSRQTPTEKRPVDMNALFREMAGLMERTTLAKVRLVLDLAPDLRPILGDGSALTHAVMNLGVNAVDAMNEGGTLAFRTRNLGLDQVEITVQDDGSGMTPEVLAKAMNPFFTTKTAGKGTGLGLSLVFTTVNAHGGSLRLLSEPGQGTQVVMTFPAMAWAAPEAGQEAAVRRGQAGKTIQILLVDDDDLIRKSTRTLVEALGHRLTAAGSGEAALALLGQGFEPDVVILDMNMPGLGGKGTLPQLRKLRPDLPVLLATGRVDQDALDLVAAFPSVTLMSKPFGIEELRGHLEDRAVAR